MDSDSMDRKKHKKPWNIMKPVRYSLLVYIR